MITCISEHVTGVTVLLSNLQTNISNQWTGGRGLYLSELIPGNTFLKKNHSNGEPFKQWKVPSNSHRLQGDQI